MKKVYIAQNLPEAHIISGALQNEGIDTEVRNEYLSGVFGEIPISDQTKPSIWVKDVKDFNRARKLIEKIEMKQKLKIISNDPIKE